MRTNDPQGWIGEWSPRIGDPTVIGWLTVVAYVGVAGACLEAWRLARKTQGSDPVIARAWLAMAWLLLLLGINKQLDLQSALTELARILARRQGWYDHRGLVQMLFVGVVAVVGFAIAAAVAWRLRRVSGGLRQAVVGFALLVAFVVIRAASFHHVDRLLGFDPGGVRLNWLVELGGIAWIGSGAIRSNLAGRRSAGSDGAGGA